MAARHINWEYKGKAATMVDVHELLNTWLANVTDEELLGVIAQTCSRLGINL